MPPPRIELATPCFPACPSNHSAIGRDIDHVVRTLTVLCEDTILQELCIVGKGYIENKNKRTLFTYSFAIDAIITRLFIQKKKFFVSYMFMTLYNIYSFFI